MLQLTGALIALLMAYTVVLFAMGRRTPMAVLLTPERPLLFVFVVPCLNEELVIAATLERLLALPGSAVLVVDDGSSDATASIVAAMQLDVPAAGEDRLWLVRREPPQARQGKGEALNAGFRHLVSSGVLDGRRPEDVVVAVTDADGRLEGDVLRRVAGFLAEERVGAVQIGVRMYNASHNVLTRLQDFEFATFGRIFQQSRHFLGSAGLGGNGQFTRLSALSSLGPSPWTRCLAEDLDLGLRLLAAGWKTAFCPDAAVSQQAVPRLGPLLRQRTRWFQGHLQCWSRIRLLMSSDLPLRVVLDLVYHITGPALVLVMTVPVIGFTASVLVVALVDPAALASILVSDHGLFVVVWYEMAFGACPLYASAYREVAGLGWIRSWLLAHLFTLYAYLWFPAGWAALWRLLRQHNSWRKTARSAEPGFAG